MSDFDPANLMAYAALLPAGGMFTGLTACAAWNLWLPPRPSGPLDVSVPRESRGSRRSQFRVFRIADPPAPWSWNGVPVAPLGEALLTAASDLSVLDVTVLVDSALRSGHIDRRVLEHVATVRRRGAPALRQALGLTDSRAESPWETVLRLFHRSVNVDVTPQAELRTADGRFLARADLLIDGTSVLQEYDGAGHLQPGQYRADRRRDADLTQSGFIRHGWTAPDLTRDYLRIMEAADRALARPSDVGRLTPWRIQMAASWFGARKVVRTRAT